MHPHGGLFVIAQPPPDLSSFDSLRSLRMTTSVDGCVVFRLPCHSERSVGISWWNVTKTTVPNASTAPKVCHPERRAKPEVEGSSHFRDICSKIGAKILRLPAVAQDDKSGAGSCAPIRHPDLSNSAPVRSFRVGAVFGNLQE